MKIKYAKWKEDGLWHVGSPDVCLDNGVYASEDWETAVRLWGEKVMDSILKLPDRIINEEYEFIPFEIDGIIGMTSYYTREDGKISLMGFIYGCDGIGDTLEEARGDLIEKYRYLREKKYEKFACHELVEINLIHPLVLTKANILLIP